MIYSKTRPKIRFLLIIFLLIGVIFILDALIMNPPVELSEALRTEAHYESYKALKGKYDISSFYLHFEDHKKLELLKDSVSDSLIRHLNALNPGTKLTLLLHPHSNTVLSIHSESLEILSFDSTFRILAAQQQTRLIQSMVCCCAAIYCALWLRSHPKPKKSSPLL